MNVDGEDARRDAEQDIVLLSLRSQMRFSAISITNIIEITRRYELREREAVARIVSVYLQDDTLRKLDAMVKRCAAEDRANGLTGRRVVNRSRLIERIVEEYVGESPVLDISEITYHVVDLAQEYGAKKVSLFGSYARGEAGESSDVDILLDKGDIFGVQVLDFQDELERRLGCSVDVVTTAGVSERFLEKISEDEVVLYAAS